MDLKEIDPPSVCQVMLDSTTENLEEKLKVLRNLKKGKELPCPHGCTDKMFKSQAYLRYHLKCYHSGVPRRYECPECPLVFAKAHRDVQ